MKVPNELACSLFFLLCCFNQFTSTICLLLQTQAQALLNCRFFKGFYEFGVGNILPSKLEVSKFCDHFDRLLKNLIAIAEVPSLDGHRVFDIHVCFTELLLLFFEHLNTRLNISDGIKGLF